MKKSLCMKKWFRFEGRMARGTYWKVMLLSYVFAWLLGEAPEEARDLFVMLLPFVAWIVLASSVKRCRDCGYSLWWLLAFPLFGFVLLFKAGENNNKRCN